VFVGSNNDCAARLDDTAKQLLDLFLSRLGVWSSELLFENPPLDRLSRPHRATSSQLRIVEPVDEVGCADQEIDVHGPVLAVFEGSKTVEDQRLFGRLVWTALLVKKKTMSAKAVREASHCGVGDACLSRDLTKSGAGNEAVEDGLEEVASAEPVVDGKGL
jgi:hypothetical protein